MRGGGTALYLEHSWFIPSTSKRKNSPIHFAAKKLEPTWPSMEHKDDGTSMNWEPGTVHNFILPIHPHISILWPLCAKANKPGHGRRVYTVSFLHAIWCCLNFSALPFAAEDNTDEHGYADKLGLIKTDSGQGKGTKSYTR